MRPIPLSNPPNPWSPTVIDYGDYEEGPPETQVHVFEDHTKKILSRNDSPDVGFSWSVNPYRGCMHACAYCYARPTHEYLGFGAGTDFDTQIVVKRDAAALLREAFERSSWQGEMVAFSGVTDCYQPLEASLELTRACLEVCLEYKNPVGVITKAPLVERDAELLAELNRVARARVIMSIPFWDRDTARAIEPRVATPERRVRAIQTLVAAGVPVGVNVAPIIPGLNDHDLADVLTAARDAGATSAGYVLLRLPGSTREVFTERLRERLPLSADKVLHRIRNTRGGKMNDAQFGTRMRGDGEYATTIQTLFDTLTRKLGYGERNFEAPVATFTRPPRGQLSLF